MIKLFRNIRKNLAAKIKLWQAQKRFPTYASTFVKTLVDKKASAGKLLPMVICRGGLMDKSLNDRDHQLKDFSVTLFFRNDNSIL
jgi:hypothetical protein